MRYCEKCGNKIKEEYAFCDKCGAKIEKTNKKEKVKDKKETSPVIMQPIKVKTGKGKLILLIILNILLLASTITFLVLWLTKPTTKSYSNNNGNNKEEKQEKNIFIGKWEQNVEYKSGNRIVQSLYGSIDFKDNYTFKATYYDKDDKNNTFDELSGTYTVNGDKVTLEWINNNERQHETYTIEDNKLCINNGCTNYLEKNGYNNKIVLYLDEEETIEKINYSKYNELLNAEKDAIVIVVRDGCSWCEKFESVVEELDETYTTPIYYYEYDRNIDVAGTPTTIVIKAGNVIDKIEGYRDFSVMKSLLDDLEIK